MLKLFSEMCYQFIPVNGKNVVTRDIVLESIVVQRVEDIRVLKIGKAVAFTKFLVLLFGKKIQKTLFKIMG
jgi:hypothetical protein